MIERLVARVPLLLMLALLGLALKVLAFDRDAAGRLVAALPLLLVVIAYARSGRRGGGGRSRGRPAAEAE